MITVIDYGMGNLRSVVKAVEKYTDRVAVSDDPSSVEKSDALIMPGDGAFGMAMDNLSARGWIGPINDFIEKGGHFFGICLGFQLLFSTSEEFGSHRGLDIIPGDVVRFNDEDLKVPHMGWNTVDLLHESTALDGIPSGSYFYFIHSYYPEVRDRSWVIGEVEYGKSFPCVVRKGNIIATQFHPEKSHTVGLKIIENFVRAVC
ncbi:MAG TPA: imidazole glycerol phosphate synthase subunit HisH [Spirochaetota bacterium]|nr:imidazole glycerol phosphate synthase subunit HisH [Spirochaetota bacterium]